jgi:hypothetical protein
MKEPMNIEKHSVYLGGEFFAAEKDGRRIAVCGWFRDEDGKCKQLGRPLAMEFLKAALARGAEVYAMDAASGNCEDVQGSFGRHRASALADALATGSFPVKSKFAQCRAIW